MLKSPIVLLLCLLPLAAWAGVRVGLVNHDRQRLVLTRGADIRLVSNPEARDPTLTEALDFVRRDPTNQRPYIDGQWMCSEFAVRFYNAAQAAGLRCGVVSLQFASGRGHTLNVFQTTDHGKVFIDCTGEPGGVDDPDRNDTIGYVKIGRPYGRLSLAVGADKPRDYAHFQEQLDLFRAVSESVPQLAQEREALSFWVRYRATLGPWPSTGSPIDPWGAALEAWSVDYNLRANHLKAQAVQVRGFYEDVTAPVVRADIWW